MHFKIPGRNSKKDNEKPVDSNNESALLMNPTPQVREEMLKAVERNPNSMIIILNFGKLEVPVIIDDIFQGNEKFFTEKINGALKQLLRTGILNEGKTVNASLSSMGKSFSFRIENLRKSEEITEVLVGMITAFQTENKDCAGR